MRWPFRRHAAAPAALRRGQSFLSTSCGAGEINSLGVAPALAVEDLPPWGELVDQVGAELRQSCEHVDLAVAFPLHFAYALDRASAVLHHEFGHFVMQCCQPSIQKVIEMAQRCLALIHESV
jgi:hypothetical protein